MGRSERRELRNRIAIIIEHLLKLQFSPALDPGSGWMETIERERATIERLLEDSPSLRSELAGMIAAETPRAARLAARGLEHYGEIELTEATKLRTPDYTVGQVLGDWFPNLPSES